MSVLGQSPFCAMASTSSGKEITGYFLLTRANPVCKSDAAEVVGSGGEKREAHGVNSIGAPVHLAMDTAIVGFSHHIGPCKSVPLATLCFAVMLLLSL